MLEQHLYAPSFPLAAQGSVAPLTCTPLLQSIVSWANTLCALVVQGKKLQARGPEGT